MRCSSSRSLKSGTAVSNRSATARGGRLSMLSYHTSSLRGAARAVENPDIVGAIMAKPRRGDVLDLTIDDLAFGGEGVGRVQGYVLFVRGAVPGDRVRAKVIEARSRFGRAVIESLDTPSPDRVEAPCAYFGRCGGCRLQHLSYTAQLAFKERQVRDCLERIGGLGTFELRPILAAPDPYGYRNKMEFTVVRSGDGDRPAIGLHQADRYDVVLDIERCLLQSETMNGLLDELRTQARARKLSVYDQDSGEGLLRFATLREGRRTGEAMVNIRSEERRVGKEWRCRGWWKK